MKTRCHHAVLGVLVLMSACKKTSLNRDVEFTSTTYSFLGNYDSTGMPDYLSRPDTISASLFSFISNNLPDTRNLAIARPDLFTGNASADIVITKPTDLYLTFVSADAGFTNSIAFYTYSTAQPPSSAADIKTISYIFPNAGNQTPLKPGDKVKVGSFQPGTSVGFLLLENAWSLITHSLNNNVVHFCTDDILNPETNPALRKHAVQMYFETENKVLISFEDTNRTEAGCDNDFNDVVIYCTLNTSP